MSYGYLGNSPSKISELKSFINKYSKSGLRDDAIYELANSYVKANEVDKAMSMYEKLYKDYRRSAFTSKALLRQGLVYYNTNDNERALNRFKRVAKEFPGSGEAVQAVATARLIYIDIGKVNEYANWVQSLDYIEVTDVELDNTMYLAAEKPYLDGNADNAIKQFNNYLNRFPNGIHTLKSHFYLAQLYYKKDLFDNAKPHYQYVRTLYEDHLIYPTVILYIHCG